MHMKIAAIPNSTPIAPSMEKIARRVARLLLLVAANAVLVAVVAGLLYLSSPAPRPAQAAISGALKTLPTPGNLTATSRQPLQPAQPIAWADRYADGTPDFLRLDSAADRESFRRWFTLIAEYQSFRQPSEVPAEINDCAALLRYSYRNASASHDSAWTRETGITPPTDPGTISQYRYPFTPLGAGAFPRATRQPRLGDAHNGAFAEFADAKTLKSFNTLFHLARSSRRSPRRSSFLPPTRNRRALSLHDLRRAKAPGCPNRSPIGAAPWWFITPARSASSTGEMRRVTLAELLDHPSPRWRPVAGNSNFLGVYRWNILREDN